MADTPARKMVGDAGDGCNRPIHGQMARGCQLAFPPVFSVAGYIGKNEKRTYHIICKELAPLALPLGNLVGLMASRKLGAATGREGRRG